MKIRFYQNTDKERWDQYVMNHPLGTFFHLTGWKNVIEKSFGHKSYYLIAEEIITHRLPLEQWQEAFEALESREAIKAILEP